MIRTVAQNVSLSGLFVATGVILPFATSHVFGVTGTIFLPMHLPVLLAGVMCGPKYGAMCGFIIPLLSNMLTGMPATYPILPIMTCQMIVLGLVGGYFVCLRKLPLMLSLFFASAAGWVTYGLVFAALLFSRGNELHAPTVATALLTGMPGLLVQMILIPLIMKLRNDKHKKTESETKKTIINEAILQEAKMLLKTGNISCVVIKDNLIVYTINGHGISPLLDLYNNQPEMLCNAIIVDKIIGKAAAMILTAGGAAAVYGEIMSASANKYLSECGIEVQYGMCVDVISARDGLGICPIERSVLGINDPETGIKAITQIIEDLQSVS